MELRCPFLVNDCCQIYDYRPLACREYLILEGSGPCGGDCIDSNRRVDIPISIAQILADTCCKLQGRDNTVVLPLAIPYAYDNPDDARRTFPAETLLYNPPRLERDITTEGARAWRVTYRFTYRPEGWNKFPRRGYDTMETVYKAGGAALEVYDTGDFTELIG